MTTITILGFGVAGQLLLSHILDTTPVNEVAIIDQDFTGGHLATVYGGIKSNTTIGQKAEALRKFHPAWHTAAKGLEAYGPPEACLRTGDLAYELHTVGMRLAEGCLKLQTTVKRITWKPEQSVWILTLENGKEHKTRILCCATGMLPRQVDCAGLPTIPLRVALDPDALKRLIRPGENILLLGPAHSGTLALKHCLEIPEVTIHVAYRGEAPFAFARDGVYDGIKQESEKIADETLSGVFKERVQLISVKDTPALVTAARKATWLINATGFVANLPEVYIDHEQVALTIDPALGTASGLPRFFCFGACAPNETVLNGKRYPDISVGSFVDQILQRIPALQVAIQDIHAS